MIYKSKKAARISKITRRITEDLAEREKKWSDDQTIKLKARIEEKLLKAANQKDYTKKLLCECKSWKGPADSGEDLQSILRGKATQYHILRTEMSYYVHTHNSNKVANKSLFRLNKIKYEEMLENLIILLDGEKHESTATVANLPSNETVLKSMSENENPAIAQLLQPEIPEKLINTMCVVVWTDGDFYSWYIGYIKEHCGNNTYEVDHLSRAVKTSDTKWKYPSTPDIQQVHREQMVECDIVGQWDMNADSRKILFHLENDKTLSFVSKNHISEL